MTGIVTGTFALAAIGMFVALLLVAASRRLTANDNAVVSSINRLLPQTQCAQCGYPGCKPYAEAIAKGAAINRCPPGGEQTIAALANLLGRSVLPLDPDCGEPAAIQVARIREAECIGCTLCIRACPVDAIMGAQGFMHTIIESECTGCELCLPPCPVDCIDLLPLATAARAEPAVDLAPVVLDCIRCDRCESACPKDLSPQNLYWYREDDEVLASLSLDKCIECRLCDRACPSELPLTQIFRQSKARIRNREEQTSRARHAEARFEARMNRLQVAEAGVRTRPTADEKSSLLLALKQDGD